MSTTVTLSIAADDGPNEPPAHESTHPSVIAALSKLASILRDSGTGDTAVHNPDDSSPLRESFRLIDTTGNTVGSALIERH